MIRVSATTLESFRRLLRTSYADEAQFIAQVKREPTAMPWYVEAGSAWDAVLTDPAKHSVIEYPDGENHHPCYRSGDYVFSERAVNRALEALGPGIVQVKAVRDFQTSNYGLASLVAQADRVHGGIVTDNKFKASTPDARDYENSLQWRCYLAVHQAQCFRYMLYDFHDPKDGYCDLRGIMTFNFYPYESMESDVLICLNCFLDWADQKELLPFLDREATPF